MSVKLVKKEGKTADKCEVKEDGACVFCGASKHISEEPNGQEKVSEVDRYLHSTLNNIFGMSPGSLATAYFDWMVHLSLSPGKQVELAKNAGEKAALFANYIAHNATGGKTTECCIHPMPQDRRFDDEGWKQWPYNAYQQSFLLMEEWWQKATSSVRGVSQHHTDIVPFLTRQWLDIFSPLNYPATNIYALLKQFHCKRSLYYILVRWILRYCGWFMAFYCNCIKRNRT